MHLPRPTAGTGKWWVVGILGCTVGIVLAVWFGLAATVGRVSWTDTGYRVIDDRTVEVRFDVHRQPGQAVTCTVRALDRRFGTVGTLEVPLPPSPQTSVSQTVVVRTTTRAVTGVVRECRATP